MKAEDLTKEQVKKMSDEEIVFWYKQFAEQDQIVEMRRGMLNHIEIREASESRILPLHVDSTVVD